MALTTTVMVTLCVARVARVEHLKPARYSLATVLLYGPQTVTASGARCRIED